MSLFSDGLYFRINIVKMFIPLKAIYGFNNLAKLPSHVAAGYSSEFSQDLVH